MFDWIPLEYYSTLFFNIVLLLAVRVWFKLNKKNNLPPSSKLGFVMVLGLILYMGLRPISGKYFIDMVTYAAIFENIAAGNVMTLNEDVGFDFFIQSCAKIMTVEMFFLVCAIIYILPLWYLSKKWFNDNWFYAFLMLIGSLSFWAYGTNGIRNGLATSLFLLALVFTERKVILFAFLLLSCSIHKSMVLPSLAYVLTFVYNDPKKYFLFWLSAIPLSLALGGFWEIFFAGLGFGDERTAYLTSGNINEDEFSSTGFRWDFLLYSATGVFAGYYFIIKKGFTDKTYNRLLNTYLMVNGFWILIIRANFSNRFAYLSWFMLGLVIVYPLLKQKGIHPKLIAKIIFIYIFFMYFMNIFLAK